VFDSTQPIASTNDVARKIRKGEIKRAVINGVKVTVTLMLKPGTTVSVVENEQQETKEDQPQGET
jgi:hypothetical protein